MIPIRNVYAMLAFCWRDVALIDAEALGACDFERPLDVAARLLDVALTRLFRRGVELRYSEREEAGARPRGTVDLPRTVRGLLRARGQIAFRVDELSEDTPANRMLKATVRSLLKSPEVEFDVRQKLRRHVARFADVADVAPIAAMNVRGVVPRNEHVYSEALWLARLTMSRWLPDEGIGGVGRMRVRRSQDRTGKLFEGFIRGVARHFLGYDARVSAPLLEFDVREANQRARMLVPQMRTDAVITWPSGRRHLIECKFYDAPLEMPERGEQAKFRSAHLYQALSYLNALKVTDSIPSGTIVYASPGGVLDETMVLQGFPLRVVWVNLAAEWPVLRDQVLDVVSWCGAVRV